jgi:hypothetical protein
MNKPNMKASRHLIASCLIFISVFFLKINLLQASFSLTKGQLYVYQIGDGNTNGFATATAAAPIFIDEFSTDGTSLGQVMLPTNGAVNVIASLNSATEGSLSLSPSGDALIFMGYTNDGSFFVGKASVNSSGPATNSRSILAVNADGAFYVAAANTNFYKPSAGAGRGAVTDGNGNYWAAGSGPGGTFGAGVDYYGTNANAGQLAGIAQGLSTPRSIGIYGTNLYFTGGTLLYSLPTVSTANGPITPSVVITDGGTPEGFIFNTNMTVCYIAEGAANPGGIRRYDYDSVNAVWANSYTFAAGTGFGFVAADFSVANPVIYATTLVVNGLGNQLVAFEDMGAGSGSYTPPEMTVLATAATNNLNYNGIVFDSVTVAAPSLPLLLTSSKLISGAFTFSSVNNTGLSFKVYATTNLALTVSNWDQLGVMTESPAGQYQFTDFQATNCAQRFYQIRWP